MLIRYVLNIDIMPAGSYLSSSFLYVNLGCHMMFILKNRLQAQGIPAEKGLKIIHELTSAIFKDHFMSTLLRPQQPMTVGNFKDLFRKLAHSSIMKLDQSSMEKLLYLILMTVKKQIFLTSSPFQVYALTLGNLKLLQQYARGTPAEALLQSNINKFVETASTYSFREYLEIREYLLSLLEGYQTKVINFHESGHQNAQGKLTFQRRNTHQVLPLGHTQNHPNITLPPPQIAKPINLPLSQWQTWKTSLVVDHVSEYDKQSERRKINNEMGWVGKDKNLNQMFGIGQDSLDDFEVELDLFDYGAKEKTGKEKKEEKNKTVEAKGGQIKGSSLREKIDKQFEEVNQEGEDELDLLQMMDS